MMDYKGYTAKIEYDDSIDELVGFVVGLRDGIHFHAASVEDIEEEFHTSVDVYLEWMAEEGRAPDRPYSGNIGVRADPGLHRRVAMGAELLGMSMNSFIIHSLSDSVQHIEIGGEEEEDDPLQAEITETISP